MTRRPDVTINYLHQSRWREVYCRFEPEIKFDGAGQ